MRRKKWKPDCNQNAIFGCYYGLSSATSSLFSVLNAFARTGLGRGSGAGRNWLKDGEHFQHSLHFHHFLHWSKAAMYRALGVRKGSSSGIFQVPLKDQTPQSRIHIEMSPFQQTKYDSYALCPISHCNPKHAHKTYSHTLSHIRLMLLKYICIF